MCGAEDREYRQTVDREEKKLFESCLEESIDRIEPQEIGFIGITGSWERSISHDIDLLSFPDKDADIGSAFIELNRIYEEVEELLKEENDDYYLVESPRKSMQDQTHYIASIKEGEEGMFPVHSLFFPDYRSFKEMNHEGFIQEIEKKRDFKQKFGEFDLLYELDSEDIREERMTNYRFLLEFNLHTKARHFPEKALKASARSFLPYMKHTRNLRIDNESPESREEVVEEIEKLARRLDEQKSEEPTEGYSEPEMVIDLESVRDNFRRISSASNSAITSYAIKSNYNPEIIEAVYDMGGYMEAMTVEEYSYLRNLDIEPKRIILNGHRGTDIERLPKEELPKIFSLTGYSLNDIERIGKKAREEGMEINVGARVETRPCSNSAERTEGQFNGLHIPFNLTLREDRSLKNLLQEYEDVLNPKVLLGMAGYSISEEYAVSNLAEDLEEINRELGFEYIDIGGGYASESVLREEDRSIEDLFKLVDIDYPLIIEPGRYIVEDACYIDAEIKSVAQTHDYDGVCILNTGMNLLPPLERANYRLELKKRSEEGGSRHKYLVRGHTSASTDVIGELNSSREPEEGEIMRIRNCGAYTSNLSDNLGIPEQKAYRTIIK